MKLLFFCFLFLSLFNGIDKTSNRLCSTDGCVSQKEKSSSATLPWIRCVRAFITTSCVDGDSELEKERKSLRAAIIADPAIQLSNVLGPPAYATPEWARYAGWEFYPFPKSRSDTSQTSLVEDRTPVCRDKRLGPVLFAGDRICLRRTDTENHSWYDAFASQVLRSSADSVDLCEIDLLEFHPILQNPKEGGCIPCEKVVWSDTRKRILLRVPEREGGTLHTSSQPLKACYVFRMGLRYTEPFHLLPRGKLLIQYPKKEPLYNTIVVSEAELTLSVQLSFLYRAYRNWVGSRAMISVEYRSASTTYSPIPNIALRFSHASLSRRHRVIRSFPSNHKVPLKQIMSRFSTYAEKGLAKSTQYEDFPEHQWELLLPSKELRSGWYRVVFHGVDLLEAPIEDNGFLPPAVPKTYSEDFFIRNQAEKLEEVVFLSPEPQPVPLLLSSTAFLSAEKQLPVYFEEEMINVTWTKGERLTKCGLAIKAGLPTNDESRAAISWLASAVTVSKETSTSISSSAIQTLALAAKKTENVFHFYMNCTERSGGRFSFRYAPRSYFVYSTPFLILRNSDARSWLKQNLDSENQFHSALARLRHRAIQSGLRTDIMDRCCAWRRLLKYENTVTWPIGYTESLMEATTSVQIKKDLSRCRYGNTTDLKQQDDLWFIMKQVFSNDHEASYYQGLNEVALVPYLLCSKDDAIPLMHLLKKYWIRPHLTHGMKFTQALYRLVHPLVEYRNPIVARHIEASGHMEGNYAMAWIATLFATAYDKGPVHVVGRFFDFFFATDPLFMPVYLSASMMLHARLELDRTYDTILRQSNQLGLEDPEMFHMYQTILAVPHLYGTDEVNELYAAGQNSELLEAALHTAHDLYRSCPPQRLMLYSSGRNPCLNISLITSQVEQGLTPPVSSEIADLYVSTDQMDELTNEVVFENTRFLLDVSFVSHEGTGSSTDRTSGSPVKEIVGGTRNADSDRENVSTPADDETTSGILFTTAARIARYTSYIFRDVNVGPDSSTHPRSTGHMLDIDALERILRTEAEDELHHLRSMGAQFSDAMQEVIQRLRVKLQRAYAHLFNRLRWAPREYRELRVTPFLSAEMSSLPSPAREIIISLTPEVLIGALEDAFRKEGEEWNHFQSEDTSDDESSVEVPSTDSSGNTAENTPVGSLRGRQLRLHVTSGTLFQNLRFSLSLCRIQSQLVRELELFAPTEQHLAEMQTLFLAIDNDARDNVFHLKRLSKEIEGERDSYVPDVCHISVASLRSSKDSQYKVQHVLSEKSQSIRVLVPKYRNYVYATETQLTETLAHLFFDLLSAFELSSCHVLRIPLELLTHGLLKHVIRNNLQRSVPLDWDNDSETYPVMARYVAQGLSQALLLAPDPMVKRLLTPSSTRSILLISGSQAHTRTLSEAVNAAFHQVIRTCREERSKHMMFGKALFARLSTYREGTLRRLLNQESESEGELVPSTTEYNVSSSQRQQWTKEEEKEEE